MLQPINTLNFDKKVVSQKTLRFETNKGLEDSIINDLIDRVNSTKGFTVGLFDGMYAPAAFITWAKRLKKDYHCKSEKEELARFSGQGVAGLGAIAGTPFAINELAKQTNVKTAVYVIGTLVLTNVLSYYASKKNS